MAPLGNGSMLCRWRTDRVGLGRLLGPKTLSAGNLAGD